jgi:cytidine deaminase
MSVELLVDAAVKARMNAYAPYSVYKVGAAVLSENGAVHAGCNVENVSYGLCLCAERSAVASMVSSGCREVVAVAVVTRDGGTPCGMCLQTLVEFSKDPSSVPVICVDEKGGRCEFSLKELLPHGFSSDLAGDAS